MATRKTDCGLQVIEHLFKMLKLEEKTVLRQGRGFTWWGDDLAQRVWADPAVQRDGVTAWKVHARTDFLKDFVASEEHFGALGALAEHASLGGGLIRDEQRRDRIQFASCLYATEPTLDWATGFFPTLAATQAAEAHLMATMFSGIAGCTPAHSYHPVAGPGLRHRALDVLGSWVRGGKNPPIWTREDFEQAAAEIEEFEVFPPSVSDSGITIEFPFGDSRAVCEMVMSEHPTYYNGLLVRLKLPVTLSDVEDPEIVLRCNILEINSITQADHFSGSCYADDNGFTYRNFIPNLDSFQIVPFLTSMIRLMSARSRWFAEAIGREDWPVVQVQKPPTWLN
jgi:hypothetical protein